MMLAFLLTSSCYADPPTMSVVAPQNLDPSDLPTATVEQRIEQVTAPEVERQLAILRETVKELHGPEAVERIMAASEAAQRKAAEEAKQTWTEQEKAKAEAVHEAVREAYEEPPALQTGDGEDPAQASAE